MFNFLKQIEALANRIILHTSTLMHNVNNYTGILYAVVPPTRFLSHSMIVCACVCVYVRSRTCCWKEHEVLFVDTTRTLLLDISPFKLLYFLCNNSNSICLARSYYLGNIWTEVALITESLGIVVVGITCDIHKHLNKYRNMDNIGT